jgi:hypothetical protein
MISPNITSIDSIADYTMVGLHLEVSLVAHPVPYVVEADTRGISLFYPESVDWDAVHEAVQDILSKLAEHLLAAVPGAKWKAGRAGDPRFPLFSYQVYYHLDGDDYDPIVVGVDFAREGFAVRVSGDISGDETGHIYFDEDCEQTVAARTKSVIDGASRIARRLASQHETVLHAIRQRHPRARRG